MNFLIVVSALVYRIKSECLRSGLLFLTGVTLLAKLLVACPQACLLTCFSKLVACLFRLRVGFAILLLFFVACFPDCFSRLVCNLIGEYLQPGFLFVLLALVCWLIQCLPILPV